MAKFSFKNNFTRIQLYVTVLTFSTGFGFRLSTRSLGSQAGSLSQPLLLNGNAGEIPHAEAATVGTEPDLEANALSSEESVLRHDRRRRSCYIVGRQIEDEDHAIFLGEKETDIECKMCFQSIIDSTGQKPQLACTRESCSQLFHEDCLLEWFRSNSGKYSDTCPICTKCIRDIDNEVPMNDQDCPSTFIKLHMRRIVTRPSDGKIYAEIDPVRPPLSEPALPPTERRERRCKGNRLEMI